MSVTSSSAKIKYFVGDFDLDTSLTIPSSSQNDTLTLQFEELISPQLSVWGAPPREIYALLKVTFEGTEIYKNSGYDTISTSLPPTDPDITITPDGSSGPATEEVVTVQNYIPLAKDSSGVVQNGLYSIEAKFVYWALDTNYASEIGTFTANFSFLEKQPSVTTWYDPQTPILRASDSQSYILNSITADRDIEFSLKPPLGNAAVVNTFDNIQSVSYSTFWTGGNELTYTALLTYEYSSYIIVNAQQKYSAFTIYDIDNCKIFNCLNEQYDLWKSSACGGKSEQLAKDALYEATAIAFQITQGLGCNSDELSSLIEDFNELVQCDCGCFDSSPRQLGSASTVLDDNIQNVSATTATTVVDLSEGSTVFMTLSTGGGTTEIQATNIVANTNYRIILTRGFSTQSATFDSDTFQDADGTPAQADTSGDFKVILDFFATDSSTLTLVSRNDI